MAATIARAAGEASLARAIFVDRAQMSREGAWSHDRALSLRLLVMFCAFLSSVVCRLPSAVCRASCSFLRLRVLCAGSLSIVSGNCVVESVLMDGSKGFSASR